MSPAPSATRTFFPVFSFSARASRESIRSRKISTTGTDAHPSAGAIPLAKSQAWAAGFALLALSGLVTSVSDLRALLRTPPAAGAPPGVTPKEVSDV